MSKQKTLHVVLRNAGWVVRKEDKIRAISTHSTQREAIDVARKIARSNHGALIIHRKDGRVWKRHRYNSDPLPAKSTPEVLFPYGLTDKKKEAIRAAVRLAMTKTARRSSRQVERRGKSTVKNDRNSRPTRTKSLN